MECLFKLAHNALIYDIRRYLNESPFEKKRAPVIGAPSDKQVSMIAT